MSFKAVAGEIAARQGISKERASAILAAGTRRAGAAARRKNPKLNRVKGRTMAKTDEDAWMEEQAWRENEANREQSLYRPVGREHHAREYRISQGVRAQRAFDFGPPTPTTPTRRKKRATMRKSTAMLIACARAVVALAKAARFDPGHFTRTCDACGQKFGAGATKCPSCGHVHQDRMVMGGAIKLAKRGA